MYVLVSMLKKMLLYLLFSPVDDMTRRLDELEASLSASGSDAASATIAK